MQDIKTTTMPVLIDCDPGADDFFALIWALIMHKKGIINLVAITTSGGNVAAQSTYENAIRACMMIGVDDVPIALGKNKEWAEHASHIHGSDGIGGLSQLLPAVEQRDIVDSESILLDSIQKYGKELTLLTIGPLSNLARVELAHPGSLQLVKRVVSMGGAFFVAGNVSPVAEFNVWYDPESAKVVYDSGVDIVALPLDVTTKLTFGMEDLEPVLSHINHQSHRDFVTKLTEFVIKTNMQFRETHYRKWFFVHDAHAIGFVLYPHIYKGSYYHVNIETKGEFTAGETIVDARNYPKTDANIYVVTDVDGKAFLEVMTEDFKEFDFGE
jgi:inosine-uridine nucleoside N-ribohydrolase